ncbi:hypothetical protein TWF694_003344 [Orbilia ellipsospora]|uniref:Phosphatidylserine decarboxylase n=1 Tax=Orbilia ellipsospora TaxID=2528407 RepID=A0AAV9X1B9_9PEZI
MSMEAANPKLGTVAILMIGMAEVSSVDFMGRKKGDMIAQGDQIGMFHFGGSTHCLIFGPNVNLDFSVSKPNAGGYVEVHSPLTNIAAIV